MSAKTPQPCRHEQFYANVNINTTEAARGNYWAEVSIRCAQCRIPFTFVGVPVDGKDPYGPVTNPTGDELCAPVMPFGQKRRDDSKPAPAPAPVEGSQP